MTRAKAIEAAMERILANAGEARGVDPDGVIQTVCVPSMFDIHEELEAMHLEGRLAGLREAARIIVKHDQWLPTGAQAEIRKLAKKARGK